MGVVEETIDVVSKREGTDSIVVGAAVVTDERVSSNGRILRSRGVEQSRCLSNSLVLSTRPQHQYRCLANCVVFIRVGENQRCGANPGIPASAGIQKER